MQKFLALFILVFSISADIPSYKIFSKGGNPSDFETLLAKVSEADVVLFGELHNNAIAHWLQLALTKKLYAIKKDALVLGAEMFETDGQLLLNEYLSGQISESSFEKESKLWPNYSTDYKPLVEFAKDNKIPFIATNIPRRYASKVAYEGTESLDKMGKEALKFICPLPLKVDSTLPGYNALLHMNMGAHGNSENFMKAQAIKDATMAYFILENLDKSQTLLHYNGAYHSNNFEGISWYLLNKKPKLRIVTISCGESADVAILSSELQNVADFIINIDQDVSKTY